MKRLLKIFLFYMVFGYPSYADHQPDWATIFDQGAVILSTQTFNNSDQTEYKIETIMSVLLPQYFDRKNVLAMCWHNKRQNTFLEINRHTFYCEIANEAQLFHHIQQ